MGDELCGEDHDGIAFTVEEDQEVGCGKHECVPADILVTGWHCGSCGHEMVFDPSKCFAEVFEGALAHERICPKVPREC
jgi:hypothetical protein